MSEGKEAYYRERAILAIERGEYDTAARHMKNAAKAKEIKRPTDKYAVGSIIRFSLPWSTGRAFYIVALKIEENGWLVYSRNNALTSQNTFLAWDQLLDNYWNESHSVHVFSEANGKVLK